MRIGIDIDDTLLSTSESFDNLINKYNLNFNKKFNDKWTQEERDFIFGNYLNEILLGAKIKKGAKDVLKLLKKRGHTLIIISARSNKFVESIEENTLDFIKKEKINIDDIYFGHSKKSDLAKKLNIDLMIDDSLYVYNNMKNDNIDCILFGDTIKTWKEVLEYIKRKER